MDRDFKELLCALNDEHVEYLIIGGYAVSLHAQPRATKDLDIFIRPEPANAAALFRALTRFGAPLEKLRPNDLIEQGAFFRMGVPPSMVDILSEVAGADFDRAWPRRSVVTIDATAGLQANFMSAEDLISAKSAAGRPQDLADVAALQAARAARKQTGKQ